jgi:hypothetical protein
MMVSRYPDGINRMTDYIGCMVELTRNLRLRGGTVLEAGTPLARHATATCRKAMERRRRGERPVIVYDPATASDRDCDRGLRSSRHGVTSLRRA